MATRTDCIDSTREFKALKGCWEELLSQREGPTAFLSFEWLFGWWSIWGNDPELRIFVVRDGSKIIGIAPLCIRFGKRAGLSFRKIGFLGEGVGSDYLDFLSEPGREEEVARSVASALAREKGWDMILLSAFDPDSRHLAVLRREMGSGVKQGERCPYLALPESWDHYLAGLSSNRRYTLRRKINHLHQRYRVEFVKVEGPLQGTEPVEDWMRLHRLRWAGRSSALKDPLSEQFHREVAPEMFRGGWGRLFFLRVNGQTAAALYGFLCGKRFLYYQAGLDPRFESQSAGLVLMALTIQEGIKAGWREFDFLRGEESYKNHWSKAVRETVTLCRYRSTMGGLLLRCIDGVRGKLVAALRNGLGPGAFLRIRMILGKE